MKRTILLLAFVTLAGVAFAQDEEPRVWVHAPAEDLLPLFPGKGAGFLISIEEYRKLVALARTNVEARKEQPPLPARLVRGTATARIDDETLRIEATYVAVVSGDRPVEVPFPLSNIALESVEIDGGGQLAGSALRFDKPGTYTVKTVLSARLRKAGAVTRTSFRLPPAAAHTVAIDLPAQVEGEVGPIVRAFRSGQRGGRVVGYPDENGLLQLWLKPRTPARRLDPLLSAGFDTVAEIGEARTTLRTGLRLEVLRAPVDKVELILAPGQTVRAVSGKGLKNWRLERAADGDKLTMTFTEPVQNTVVLGIETELPRNDAASAPIPIVKVPGAVRYRGTVGVVPRPEVRLTGLTVEGARRLDGAPKGGVALYEVWTQDAKVEASVDRVAQRTRATTRGVLVFREGGKSLALQFLYGITGRPLFRLEPTLPRGWILRSVRLNGRPVPHRFEEDKGRLVLDFPAGLKPGAHSLQVSLDTDEVDWVPNEGAVAFELSGVRSGLDDETGYIVVASDPAFRVATTVVNGLEPIGMPEVARVFQQVSDRILYAWRFDRPDYAVRFGLERQTPQITATVMSRLLPSERMLKVHASILLDIQRTGVRELKVELPKGTGKLVDFKGPLIKERRAPADDADPETWTIVFQKRVRGDYRLEVSFDEKFESDAWSAVAPEIVVPGTQERGFLVVHSSGTTAIEVERNGMREADVDELPLRPARPPLEVLAYARHPYEVKLSSQRHEPQPVVQAIALSAHIYGVLSNEGRLRCRAEYRIRNNDQPFLRFLLPEGSSLIGVIVDGEPSKPLLEEGFLKLALPRSRNREVPFLVAVVYESEVEALRARGELTIDRPALDIDVLKTGYTLHLPRGYELTGHDGDLVPQSLKEKRTVLKELGGLLPSPTLSADAEVWSLTGEAAEGRPASIRELAELVGALRDGVDHERALSKRGDRFRSPAQSGENRALYDDLAQQIPETAARIKDAEGRRRFQKEVLEPWERLRAQYRPASPQPTSKPRARHAEKKKGFKTADRRRAPARKGKRAAGEEQDYEEEAPEEEAAKDEGDAADSKTRFRAPKGAVPPGLREPTDSEAPPAPDADAPGGGGGGRRGQQVAEGAGAGGPTTPAKRPPPSKRKRPERALLSLDIQFLRPDNLYRLDSLAPTGRVVLSYAQVSVYDRRHFLGVVLGAAAALAVVLVRRFALLRILPATILAIVALHFAGLSFLKADFARGAAQAVLAVFGLVLVARVGRALPALGRKVRRINFKKIRIPWRRKTGTTASLLLLAAFARAEDEVFVPYRDDPSKIEQVLVPADEYHRLRRLAFPETAGRRTAFLGAEYETKLAGDDLSVLARYRIVKETEEAERIPLRLHDVAVTRALLDGQPADLTIEKGGYVLVLKGKGRYALELTLRPRLRPLNEGRTFAFNVRPVTDARLILTHDRDADDVTVVALGGKERNLYHLGPVGTVGVTWMPKTRGFKAAAAELRAQTEAVASVRDGYTALAGRIRYSISGGVAERVRIAVGKDVTVREVRCKDIAGWQVDADGNVVVALKKPAGKSLVVEVFAERAAARERTEAFPLFRPLDVVRDAGVLALETLPDLKIEVLESQGLLRGRASNRPNELAATPDKGVLHSVHRYAVRPFTLRWKVTVAETRLRARTNVDLYIEREAVYADLHLTVEVERGPGPFQIRAAMPAAGGWEVEVVRGPVRDWWVEEGTLFLDRANRQQGAATYRVVLRRRGATADAFEAPAVFVRGAVRESGLVRLAVADGLELETGETNNLLPEDIAGVGRVRWGRLLRAFRFVAVPWRLVVNTREEPREMDALVVTRVVPLADRVRVEALVNFYVRRGLVDRLSFVVPVEQEGEALISAPDLREERSEPTEGGRRFTLLLRTPTRGSASASVTYHLPYDAPLRGVEPVAVERTRRYVAVEKIPDGEVRIASAKSLDSASFDDLPLHAPETTETSVARVLAGSGGPWELTLDVKRHAFEEVARAVVYRAAAQAVVDRSGWVRVLVSYRVYNRSEQFLRLGLPDKAQLYSVLVAGEGVRPLGEKGDLLVPLRKLSLGAPTFDVDIYYAYPGPRLGRRDFDVFLPDIQDVDVRRTTLSLYVPHGFRYAFDTGMEEVVASDIAAGEATDLYEEIKELYGVAERGNDLQARRALGNLQVLEQEAQRMMDQTRAITRDQSKIQQLDSQRAALGALRRSNEARLKQVQQDGAKLGKKVARQGRGVNDWEVNRRYLDRNDGEDAKQLQEFQQEQERTKAVPDRGVTASAARVTVDGYANRPVLGAVLGDTLEKSVDGKVAGRYSRLAGAEDKAGKLDSIRGERLDLQAQVRRLEGIEGKRLNKEWSDFAADDLIAETRTAAGFGVTSFGLTTMEDTDDDMIPDIQGQIGLRAAAGRISLRIDLPQEGEVFHFAHLGAEGGVAFTAKQTGGRVLEGVLALVCAAAAVFVLRYKLAG